MKDGCTTKSYFNRPRKVITSVSEIEPPKFLANVYPNPNNGLFKLEVEGEFRGDIEMKIYDLMGKETFSKRLRKGTKAFESSFDLQSLPPGYYYIHLRSENKILQTLKFYKNN